MANSREIWSWIPARANSKRLPNKSLLSLNNKPLIQWSIEASTKSKYIDKTFVFTDSEKIKDISIKAGALCPFLRSDANAQDKSSSAAALEEFLFKMKDTPLPEFIVVLQPTSPLRTTNHINSALDLLKAKKADAIISVSPSNKSPHWMNTLPKDLSLINFIKSESINARSQDIPQHYYLNGAIYIVRTDKFLEQKKFYLDKNIYAFVMDSKFGVDIDTEEDFELAEFYLRKNQ